MLYIVVAFKFLYTAKHSFLLSLKKALCTHKLGPSHPEIPTSRSAWVGPKWGRMEASSLPRPAHSAPTLLIQSSSTKFLRITVLMREMQTATEWKENRTSAWPAPELLLSAFLMLSTHPSLVLDTYLQNGDCGASRERKSSSHSNIILKLVTLTEFFCFLICT